MVVEVGEVGRVVDALAGVLEWAGSKVAAVAPDAMGDPTPCTEWGVRALVGHMVGGNVMYAMATEGLEPDVALLHGDLLGDDPVGAYVESAARALAGWRGVDPAGTIDLPYGTMAVTFSVGTHLMDNVLHEWDVATALGLPRDLSEDLVAVATTIVDSLPPEIATAPGVFAPPVDAPGEVSAIDRLAMRCGRARPER